MAQLSSRAQRITRRSARRCALAAFLLLLSAASLRRAADLAFGIDPGQEINRFLRSADTAAHLVLRSGSAARILVAFPAGDSAVGLWLEPARDLRFSPPSTLRSVTALDSRGRLLRGIETELTASVSRAQIREA